MDIASVINKSVPSDTKYKIINNDNLPDSYFIAAWRYDGRKGITVDIEAAKEIQRNAWRLARIQKMKNLDISFMKSLENGDQTAQSLISENKKLLRDVTTTELPNDLAGIKSTWPDILN